MLRSLNSIRTACLLAGLVFFGLVPRTASAIPICQTGSLSSYIALDQAGGCMIGDFTFFRFSDPAATVTGNPTVADPSQIMLTPIFGGDSAGFSFTAMSGSTNLFSISTNSGVASVTYHINYSVDPAPVIGGSDMSLDPPFGDASATQRYCTSDVFANGCTLGVASQQTVTVASPVSSLNFVNPSVFVDIQTDIALRASPGNPAGLDSVNATVRLASTAAVPEPSSVALASAGVLILFLLARRRRTRLENR